MRHERCLAAADPVAGPEAATLRLWKNPAIQRSSDPAIPRDQTAAKSPWRPRVPSRETHMPEDLGLLSVVPIGMLVFGGLIADGDTGQLTYQGTRFKGFARKGPMTGTM
jgi:hypothetical protein